MTLHSLIMERTIHKEVCKPEDHDQYPTQTSEH